MPDPAGPNGLDVHAGAFGLRATGPNTLAYLTVLLLAAALAFLAWTNWTAFSRIEVSLATLSNDIRCLAWVAADEPTREKLPPCLRGWRSQ